ncbi:MAG: hypothetical protein QF926_14575 [Alphaproteobacteria bacterium]|jgi:hypothetical protein|nr:hypothetical protein [Alphaproteobacteria bacterium]MDP6517827.1 hypothetical protein [Alphaproteobacteria bacterium]
MSGDERAGAYAVVWPRSEKAVAITELAPRLDTLEGKTVCQLWDYMFRGDEIFPILETALAERYPGIDFIGYDRFGSTHGEDEAAIIAGLPDKLRDLGADAVISGMGC